VAITPEIVDPEYIYVATNSNIKYKKSLTNKSTGELTTVVEAAIEAQFNSDLNEFGSTLRYSGIVASIDNAEASIISNVTTIQMSRRFLKDSTNTAGIYEIQYYNKIIPGTVVSSTIVKTDVADYAIMDDGLGVMTLYNITAQAFENIEMGTVDYTTGKIELNGFLTEIDINQSISIYAAPEDTDISSEKNLLILFDSATIEATPI